MKGRTKSFFEDVLVLILLLGMVSSIYYLFFNSDEVKNQIQTTKQISQQTEEDFPKTVFEPVDIQEFNDVQENETVEDETTDQSNDTAEDIEKTTQPIQEETTQQTDTQEPQNIQKPLQEEQKPQKENILQETTELEHQEVKEEVDLAVLRKFLADLKKEIKQKIDLDGVDIEQNNFLSIRITILKNGTYEQLVFVAGNKIIYDNNVENILGVFPLTIDEKIIADFPRYIRYRFEFIQNEQ